MSALARFEILLPLRYNDGRPVPRETLRGRCLPDSKQFWSSDLDINENAIQRVAILHAGRAPETFDNLRLPGYARESALFH